jgi:hypothetical protein
MTIKGYNDFYEGWLAWILMQPFDKTKSEEWRDGYTMGDETGELALEALRPEIKIGHIIVEP